MINAKCTAVELSVVIPAFNAQWQLNRCLKSILTQSASFDFEVLIIDDGSTDNTYDLALEFCQNDGRIQAHSQSNRGAGAARNHGLSLAKGRYIHFMDADDYLEPNAYERLFSQLVLRSYPDLLFFQYREVDYLTKEAEPINLFGLEDTASATCRLSDDNYILFRTSVVPWNKLIRREFILENGISFDAQRYANDRTFHFKLVSLAKSIVLYGGRCINHEINRPSSLSSRHGIIRLKDTLRSFEHIIEAVEPLEYEGQLICIDVNIENLISEFERASSAEKIKLATLICDWLNDKRQHIDATIYRGSVWFGQCQAIRSIALNADRLETLTPLVMAANEAYVPYLKVALHSISKTMSSDAVCIVYVLHRGLGDPVTRQLETELGYTNLQVFCVDLSGVVNLENAFCRGHYSADMYLRLWIPELFDVYPKIIYLDCDLIVRRNIKDLFEIDLLNADIAGVRDFNNSGHRAYVRNQLSLDEANYINSGVLIFNTRQLRKKHFREKCLNALENHKQLSCPDQDVINMICAGSIMLIDSGWNYLWCYGFSRYSRPPDGAAWFEEDFADSREKKYIIHYCSAFKPWSYPHYEDADIFWECAKESSVYPEIRRNLITKTFENSQARLRAVRE